jgi:hypothetical protein
MDGKAHGQGGKYLKSGDKYIGNWTDGKGIFFCIVKGVSFCKNNLYFFKSKWSWRVFPLEWK